MSKHSRLRDFEDDEVGGRRHMRAQRPKQLNELVQDLNGARKRQIDRSRRQVRHSDLLR